MRAITFIFRYMSENRSRADKMRIKSAARKGDNHLSMQVLQFILTSL